MSTQILTELPYIQKAGMDFNSVLAEMKNIINDNPNWKENWTNFSESEAGIMMMELMAWIADNLSTKQDVLYNEMFITSAAKDANKVKHLKHIGYLPQMAHASRAAVSIYFDSVLENGVYLVPRFTNGKYSIRTKEILSFRGKDINGKDCDWELLPVKDGKPEYLKEVFISNGNTHYEEDSKGNTLYALQGKTKYEVFTTNTKDGSFFNLSTRNMAADSLRVYMNNGEELLNVSSFVNKDALDVKKPIPYVLEMNENQTYRIRFANTGVVGENSSRLLPAGSTIHVFYRECEGIKGNINLGFIDSEFKVQDTEGKPHSAVIKNIKLGFGGTNKETLDQAVLNGPLSLRTMDRAVTPEDYNIILGNNPLVFKNKTYTASNQPAGFKDYYGRYINPQESFTFITLNKNYTGVPVSKYNYFPWMKGNYEPRINERYAFDNGRYGLNANVSSQYSKATVTIKNSGEINFSNCSVINIGSEWNESLYNRDKTENLFAKCKLTKEKSDEIFFENIPFSLMSNDTFRWIGMGEDSFNIPYNKLTTRDYAKFTSREKIDNNIPIDIITGGRYLNFIVNDIATINVDLLKDIENPPEKFYLKWDNNYSGKENIDSTLKQDADNRKGIVQRINEQIVSSISDGDIFENGNSKSIQFCDINKKTAEEKIIETKDSKLYFSIKIKGVNYLIAIDNSYSGPESDGIRLSEMKKLFDLFFESPSSSNVEKYVDAKIVPVDTTDINIIEGCMAKVISRNIYSEDGGIKTVFDLAFVNKNDYPIGPVDIIDNDNNKYTINDAIDICDGETVQKGNDIFYKSMTSYFIGGSDTVRERGRDMSSPIPIGNYNEMARFEKYSEEDSLGKFVISSPIVGEMSSLYFESSTQAGENNYDFSASTLKIEYKDGIKYSKKVFGIRRLYMLKEKPIISLFDGAQVNLSQGNFILESNSFNNDFENVYANYKLSTNDRLKLGSVYNNFYSDDDSLKRPVVGVLGQCIEKKKYDNKYKYVINKSKSRLDVRLTKEKVNTNSIFSIKSDLDVVKSDIVSVCSNSIGNLNFLKNDILEFAIDSYNRISISLKDCTDYSSLKNDIRNTILKSKEEDIKNSVDSIIVENYSSDHSFYINGISRSNGSIKFYYNNESNNEEIYRSILGTNKTNPEFYSLYPVGIAVPEKYKVNVEGKMDEYFYMPKKEDPLTLEYRTMVKDKDDNYVSRYADYYFEISDVSGADNNYGFYIVKTPKSKFPDKEFYMHFVNDCSYALDNDGNIIENDETVLHDFMKNYMISGTDITFVQPYFRTYDISAKVRYNSNYSESEVSSSVSNAIDKTCDLKYSEIAGSMSRAKIFKAIMNCPGVEDCQITYFGEDYTSKEGNTDFIQANFYEILCLHEYVEDEHGKNIEFEAIY